MSKIWFVLVFIVLAVIIYYYQQKAKTQEMSPSTSSSAQTGSGSESNSESIADKSNASEGKAAESKASTDGSTTAKRNRVEHYLAFKEWCERDGYTFDAGKGNEDPTKFIPSLASCQMNENACRREIERQKHMPEAGRVYLEWHPEVNSCVKTYKMFESTCNKLSEQDSAHPLPYSQAQLVCDQTSGMCTPVRLPTCIIPKSYCDNKGVSYSGADGLGNCEITWAQELAEFICGSVYIRGWIKGDPFAMQKQYIQAIKKLFETPFMRELGCALRFVAEEEFEVAKKSFQNGYNVVISNFTFAGNEVGTGVKVTWNSSKEVALSSVGWVRDAFREIGGPVGDVAKEVASQITFGALTAAEQAMAKAINPTIDGLSSAIDGITNLLGI